MELENVKIFINSTRSRFRLPLLWEFFFSILLESKLLFINQLIGRGGGVGIGSETNIEIYRLCVGNTTGSLENTQIHKYQRGDFKIIQLNSPNLCVATLAVSAVDETHLKIQNRRVPGISEGSLADWQLTSFWYLYFHVCVYSKHDGANNDDWSLEGWKVECMSVCRSQKRDMRSVSV